MCIRDRILWRHSEDTIEGISELSDRYLFIPMPQNPTIAIQQEKLRRKGETKFLLEHPGFLKVDIGAHEADALTVLSLKPMHDGHHLSAGASKR